MGEGLRTFPDVIYFARVVEIDHVRIRLDRSPERR